MSEHAKNAVIQRARDEIYRICVGRGGMTKDGLVGRQWTMSIPVRDDDSDRVFAALADLATGLQAEILAARREVEALRAALLPKLTAILANRIADLGACTTVPDGCSECLARECLAALAATPGDATAATQETR